MPYGELWCDQRTSTYNERFKFTGKERDSETGYDYFGARYSGDYPNISPYAYCNGNPISLVDNNGRFPVLPSTLAYFSTAKALENVEGNRVLRTTGYIMQHPINAIKTGNAIMPAWGFSKIASNFQVNLQNNAGFSKKEGGQGNAYRHTLWQALLTNALGNDHAMRIGNVHEDHIPTDMNRRNFENMADADTMADVLNNEIGRSLGITYQGADNNVLAGAVLEEYKENGLWEVVKSEQGNYRVVKNTLSQEQYNAAMHVIQQKGKDGLQIE